MTNKHIPQAVVIDFDRTLSDVQKSVEHLYAVTKEFGIDAEKIESARRALEDDGGTFEPITYLQSVLTKDQMKEFYAKFLATRMDSFFDDAHPFLSLLEANNIPYYVLTYGVSSIWQELKVKGSGYDGPMKIMDHSDKGAEIAKWRNSEKKYALPLFQNIQWTADTICLIDDKASAFKSLPEDCTGYLIQRSKTQLPSQQGKVGNHIQTIKSLSELTIQNKILTLKR